MSSIVLVDDHEIVMDSLMYLIESERKYKVVGKYKTGQAFIDFINLPENNIDLAIIDVKLPDFTGLELVAQLKKQHIDCKCILLSQFANPEFIYAGLKLGIDSYLLKNCTGNELLLTIDRVLNDEVYLSLEISKLIVNYKPKQKVNFNFTTREKEILEQIVLGFSNKEIAAKLAIKSSTIEFHKRNLKQKMNVNKSIELVIKALDYGIVQV